MSSVKHSAMPRPSLASLHPWELYSAALGIEYHQSLEEGLDVEKYADLFRDVEALPADRIDAKEKLADTLFELVMTSPVREGYAYNEHDGHDWCHTISNAMIVAASLLYGGGDYGKSICMAVETGFDTDCNGATVGSVLGMLFGRGCIGEEWAGPMKDTLHTTLFGMDTVSISERAGMTMRHIKR